MKKVIRIIAVISLVLILAISLTGCASWRREIKSLSSDINGGLNRTVTVYDYNGKEIKSWTGKFDISESENEIFFDKAPIGNYSLQITKGGKVVATLKIIIE